jgi:hypothetical protein
MTIFKRGTVIAIAIWAPVAICHAVALLTGDGSGFLSLGLPLLGFAFMVVKLQFRPVMAVAVALFYFPLTIMLIFQAGIFAGYYDYP